MANAHLALCIVCDNMVRDSDEAVECELCNRWQHRTCNTGISKRRYILGVKECITLSWLCDKCKDGPAYSSFTDDFTSLEAGVNEERVVSAAEPEQQHEKVESASQRSHTMLIWDGYRFNVKRRLQNGGIDWQCSTRNKTFKCRASIKERQGRFIAGSQPHCHPAATTTSKKKKAV